MATVINMPRLSDTMEEGVVATWLKQVGDKIEEGDILAEIETDKATMEFESFHEGVLLHIGVQEGETAPVDTLLAIVGEAGEDISALLNGKPVTASQDTKTEAVAPVATKTVEIPAGVTVVTMPRLSDTMTDGTVASWLKQIGDTVAEGDILAEIETDKATMEFESFQEGTLLYVGLQEGETAPVDSVLAIIGPAGTDVAALAKNYTKETTEAPKEAVKKEAPKKAVVAPKKQENKAVVSNSARIFASPLAKKIANDKGVNLATLKGSGENGRIIKKDVENYTPNTSAANVGVFVPSGEEKTEDITNSQMRKVIARRLGESKFTAPHYYLNVEFDMENAMAFRKQFNTLPDVRISYNDMIVKACALALKQHPQVNSQWFDTHIQLNHHVNIGVAVAVEDGLVVPVVPFANEKTLPQIGAEVKDYAVRARQKKLTPQEMDGSTFTISNLGMFGIESFTSIINQPNSSILSVGAIVEKPVVKNGQIVVGNTMKLTLACDHRTVDGATGAQFLQTLKEYIENPVTMLV